MNKNLNLKIDLKRMYYQEDRIESPNSFVQKTRKKFSFSKILLISGLESNNYPKTELKIYN